MMGTPPTHMMQTFIPQGIAQRVIAADSRCGGGVGGSRCRVKPHGMEGRATPFMLGSIILPTPPTFVSAETEWLSTRRAYVQKLGDLKWLWNVQIQGGFVSAEGRGLRICELEGVVYLQIPRGLARSGVE